MSLLIVTRKGNTLTYYGATAVTFMSCKITDMNGNVIAPYDLTWNADAEFENKFFMHHIRLDGETYDKNIDVCADFDTARAAYAACMEYGYNNSKFPNVSFVSCEITDLLSGGLVLSSNTWVKPEQEQEETEQNPTEE